MAAREPDMDGDEIQQHDTWEIIRKYFEENGLCQQQKGSYNEFIVQNIQVSASF
jgi:hypothetical protein